MFKSTIYHFGIFLSDVFNLPIENVKLTSKDELFRVLKIENQLIELPSIAFFPTNIEFDDLIKAKYLGAKLSTSKGRSLGFDIIQIRLTFSIYIISDNIENYFDLVNKYFFIMKRLEGFEVRIHDEDLGIDDFMRVPIISIEPLGLVEGGKEGFDYDRGVYYVSNGSIVVRTFLFSEGLEKPIVKRINLKELTMTGSLIKEAKLQKPILKW